MSSKCATRLEEVMSESDTSSQEVASMAAVRLLREIVEYQQRLRRLREHEVSGDQAYLIDAYRRAMSLRRQMLDDLPKPPEQITSPWERRPSS